MNLIDSTYFQGDLLIPNLNASGPVGDALRTSFNKSITVFEQLYLKQMLGDALYENFVKGLDESVVEEKWTNLKNKFVDETNLSSPISGFVYYYYTTSKRRSSTSDESVFGSNEIIVKNWNDMVNGSYLVYEFLCENAEIYGYDKYFFFERINFIGI